MENLAAKLFYERTELPTAWLRGGEFFSHA